METNKQKALSAALTQIERQFGKGSVMRMGDATVYGILRPFQQVHWLWILP